MSVGQAPSRDSGGDSSPSMSFSFRCWQQSLAFLAVHASRQSGLHMEFFCECVAKSFTPYNSTSHWIWVPTLIWCDFILTWWYVQRSCFQTRMTSSRLELGFEHTILGNTIQPITMTKLDSTALEPRGQKGCWSHGSSCCRCCLVIQSCPVLCDPMDSSWPGSSVRGIFQARILDMVGIPFSRGIFPIQGSNLWVLHWKWILYHWVLGLLDETIQGVDVEREESSLTTI